MNKSDLQVIVMISSFLVLHLIVVILGFVTHKLAFFIPIVNTMIGITAILYWVIKSFKIKHFHVELREIAVLLIEILIIAFAIYALLNKQQKTGINIINFISFTLHIITAIGMVIFLLTFKINRLI